MLQFMNLISHVNEKQKHQKITETQITFKFDYSTSTEKASWSINCQVCHKTIGEKKVLFSLKPWQFFVPTIFQIHTNPTHLSNFKTLLSMSVFQTSSLKY